MRGNPVQYVAANLSSQTTASEYADINIPHDRFWRHESFQAVNCMDNDEKMHSWM